MLKITP